MIKTWARFVFAHGAGAGMDSEFMQVMANRLQEQGIAVHRFNFPYMKKRIDTGKRRPPDRSPILEKAFFDEVDRFDGALPLFIGGKSMGGRIASMIVERTPASGCLCLGYPFHPPGKPSKLRVDHLQHMTKPLLILQGERDTFGKPNEIATYPLCPSIHINFIPQGDHSFSPPARGSASLHGNLTLVSNAIVQFMRATK